MAPPQPPNSCGVMPASVSKGISSTSLCAAGQRIALKQAATPVNALQFAMRVYAEGIGAFCCLDAEDLSLRIIEKGRRNRRMLRQRANRNRDQYKKETKTRDIE